MKKQNNPLWSSLSSVKFALFTFFILAITSIIGTVIPQGEEAAFYIKQFGPNLARLFEVLDVPNMYNSWWFLTLLVLFSFNLIICTIDRLPNVWRMVVLDNLATDPGRLEKMGHRTVFHTSAPIDDSTTKAVQTILTDAGWKAKQGDKGENILFFSQKGAWTRLGVYGVHLSILVIFVGAIIGSVFGYKGSVMIPEGTFTDKIYKRDAVNTPVPLGFQVRCDRFSLTYYDSGAPKEFRSDLVVIDDGKETLSKSIIVNDPMDYGGLTFYQSSYQSIENQYLVTMENNQTKTLQNFVIPPRQQAFWKEENINYGVTSIGRSARMGKYRYKIWFSDGKGAPSEFWAEEETPVIIERPGTTYTFSIKQRFATGLQVTKDPGVWTVYIGCIIMLLGLYVAFFLSHRRMWALLSKTEAGTRILISGTSNKNKFGFDKEFDALIANFQQTKKLDLSRG